MIISMMTLFLLTSVILAGTPIRAGGDDAYPPFEFINDEGLPDGFTVDIVRAVGEAMSLDIEITLGRWSDVRRQLEDGEIDLITGMLRTTEREKLYDFSIPYIAMSYALFVPEHTLLHDPEELIHSRLIVQQGDAAHEFALKHNIARELVLADSYPEALRMLVEGVGEGIIMPRIQGMLLVRDLDGLDIKPVGDSLFQKNYGLAVSKGNSDLLYLLNEGLSIIKGEGIFDEIYLKWFDLSPNQGVTFQDIATHMLWVAVPLGIIILLILLWSWSLRRQIQYKSIDLERELTERATAQRELDTSRETLNTVVSLIPHLIFLADRSRRLLLVNKALCETAGRTLETPPKHVRELNIKPEELMVLTDTAREVFTTGERREISRHQFTDFTGVKRWMHTYMLPFTNTSNGETNLLGISMDITKLLDLEEQLMQSRKLEAVGQLAGGIAHDFNNQLTGVLGFAELLHAELHEPQHQEYARYILEAAGNAAELTKKLLSFARRGHYRAQYISLHDIVRQVTSIMSHTIDKRITIKVHLHAQSDILFADPTHVQNMLLNIVINARDAMPSGGDLTLSSWNEDIPIQDDEDLAGPVIMLEISDTGIGMSESVQKRIFEPFYTTKQQGKGTGMGLASVYGSIQQLGGVITVASTPGQGSTFLLKLPLASDPQLLEEIAPHEHSAAPFKKRMILVIDDEQVFQQALMAMLTAMGCRVVGLLDPLEGIRYYREHQEEIDVVILDMLMPVLNGQETFHELKRINPDIKVVIASGYSPDDSIERMYSHGVSGFILKPFQRDELIRLLEEVLP